MDTSETYIKQCEKATEIQKNHKIIDGDLIFLTNKPEDISINPVCVGFKVKFDEGVNCYFLLTGYDDKYWMKPEEFIWLPRQDQLQEMAKYKLTELNTRFANFLTRWYSGEWKINVNEYTDCRKHPEAIFTSMEQLWLAFVMKEKYNKVWDGDNWVEKP